MWLQIVCLGREQRHAPVFAELGNHPAASSGLSLSNNTARLVNNTTTIFTIACLFNVTSVPYLSQNLIGPLSHFSLFNLQQCLVVSNKDEFGFGEYGGFGGYSYGYGFDTGAAVMNRKRKGRKEKEKGLGCVPGGNAVANENEDDGASTVASNQGPWNDNGGAAADSSFVVVDASTMWDRVRVGVKRAHEKKERVKYQCLLDKRSSMSDTPTLSPAKANG
ncbi:hypothetical protein V5O48_018943 [Marasmius crinis-equi]|uniref:Uncharacterized protein n=1 Tax=Marasmius crinis-equi TaxID=585013 RepID=A0ABR3EJV4_9AGAR